MRKITSNVFAEDQFSVPPGLRRCDSGFVTTSEGVVIIDSPYMPSDAVKLRDDLAKIGEVRYLINTHQHIDHITGNYFLPGTIVSHEITRELFDAPVSSVLADERYQEVKTLIEFIRKRVGELDPKGLQIPPDYQLRRPTLTFSERMTLYVGKHTFELIHLPGHTTGHIGVYIPQERVVFAGDNVNNGVQASMAHCLPLEWVESLKKIEAMDVDVIIPGHGKICGKRELREFMAFLQKCIDRIQKAIAQGMSKEEAAEKLTFIDLYPATHLTPGMQRINVLRFYEMLS